MRSFYRLQETLYHRCCKRQKKAKTVCWINCTFNYKNYRTEVYKVDMVKTKPTDVAEQSEVGVLTKPEEDCVKLLYGSGINIDPGCKLIIIVKISNRSLNHIWTYNNLHEVDRILKHPVMYKVVFHLKNNRRQGHFPHRYNDMVSWLRGQFCF